MTSSPPPNVQWEKRSYLQCKHMHESVRKKFQLEQCFASFLGEFHGGSTTDQLKHNLQGRIWGAACFMSQSSPISKQNHGKTALISATGHEARWLWAITTASYSLFAFCSASTSTGKISLPKDLRLGWSCLYMLAVVYLMFTVQHDIVNRYSRRWGPPSSRQSLLSSLLWS